MQAIRTLGWSAGAVLANRRWAVLSLAAFLVRGGLLVLLVPLIPLPTTAALANAFGPALVGFVFGGASVSFLILAGSIVGAVAAWILLGGIVGAALDLEMARAVPARTGHSITQSALPGQVWRAFVLRLVAHAPTALTAVWGAATLVGDAYAELISPGDPTVPLVLRVILRAPAVVAILITTWVVGEAVGGAAVRHLAWGSGLRRSLGRAVRSVARPSGLLVLVTTNAVLAVVLVLTTSALQVAFAGVRFLLLDGGISTSASIALVLLAGVWLATVVLVALATGWRAVAWTADMSRHAERGSASYAEPGAASDAASGAART